MASRARKDVSRRAFSCKLRPVTRCPASLFLLGSQAHESLWLYRCPRVRAGPTRFGGDISYYLTATTGARKPPSSFLFFPPSNVRASLFLVRFGVSLSYRGELLTRTIPPKIVSAVLNLRPCLTLPPCCLLYDEKKKNVCEIGSREVPRSNPRSSSSSHQVPRARNSTDGKGKRKKNTTKQKRTRTTVAFSNDISTNSTLLIRLCNTKAINTIGYYHIIAGMSNVLEQARVTCKNLVTKHSSLHVAI